MSSVQDPRIELVMRIYRKELRDAIGRMSSSLGLYEAILQLPERQFDVVVLHHLLGYDMHAAGKVLGLNEATVRSHLRHAKARIAAYMGLPIGHKELVSH